MEKICELIDFRNLPINIVIGCVINSQGACQLPRADGGRGESPSLGCPCPAPAHDLDGSEGRLGQEETPSPFPGLPLGPAISREGRLRPARWHPEESKRRHSHAWRFPLLFSPGIPSPPYLCLSCPPSPSQPQGCSLRNPLGYSSSVKHVPLGQLSIHRS